MANDHRLLTRGDPIDQQSCRIVSPALDHRQRNRSQFVVYRHSADPTDPCIRQLDIITRTRQRLSRTIQVQQHQPPWRPSHVVSPGYRLLTAVAAFRQMHGRADPAKLMRQRTIIGIDSHPRDRRSYP